MASLMQNTAIMTYERALRLEFPDIPYSIYIDEVDNVDYRYETARLESFKNWPVLSIHPKRFAAAGFYFTGELDIVRCFECSTEMYKWIEGDDPMEDHTRQSPMCRFVRNITCGNVPIDAVPDVSLSTPDDKDVCGLYDYEPEHSTLNSPSSKPVYPRYEFYEARLRTFEFWPKSITQNPLELVAAGFYYTGMEDQLICFHCGVGVKHWEPNDDPWEQHAIWYPKCSYLLMVKGSEYVRSVNGQSVASGDLTEASYATKAESLLHDELKQNYLAGPSSQGSTGSHDSGTESMSSNNSSSHNSPTGSTECLSVNNIENLKSKPGCSKSTDDARMCKICFNEELCQLFLPCNHLVACSSCAKCIKVCPICRRTVAHHMQIFFS